MNATVTPAKRISLMKRIRDVLSRRYLPLDKYDMPLEEDYVDDQMTTSIYDLFTIWKTIYAGHFDA